MSEEEKDKVELLRMWCDNGGLVNKASHVAILWGNPATDVGR